MATRAALVATIGSNAAPVFFLLMVTRYDPEHPAFGVADGGHGLSARSPQRDAARPSRARSETQRDAARPARETRGFREPALDAEGYDDTCPGYVTINQKGATGWIDEGDTPARSRRERR